MLPLLILVVLSFGGVGCDDTAKALGEKSREQAVKTEHALGEAKEDATREAKDAKQQLQEAAGDVKRGVEQAADQAAKKLDELDKDVAREVRKD